MAMPAPAQGEDVIYGVDRWPAGLATVPCKAFQRNADKSWTQVATIVVQPGNLRMTAHKFTGAEAKMLDRRCGGK